MRVSIVTKYLPPTNYKGSRVIAKTTSGLRKIVSWKYNLDAEENHILAAKEFADKMGWKGEWHGGAIDGSSYVFVENHEKPAFTVE